MRMSTLALKTIYWVLLLVVALFVFVYFLRHSGVGINAPASVERALTGTAYRPYAYRVLLPIAANLLSPILPKDSAFRLGTQSESILGRKFFRDRLNGSLFPRQVVLILLMMYFSLVGFAVTIWHFVGALGYGTRGQYLVPPVVLLGCLPFFGFGYIYDFTTLFLFSLGLLLMALQNWKWYLIVLAFGTLNKETTVFLFVVFVFYFLSRLPLRQFIALSAWQLGVYGIIEGAIRFAFRDNRGDMMEWHFDLQLPAFTHIALTTPLLLAVWAGVLVVVAILVIRRWSEKPAFLRAALAIFPFFLILFIFWAWPMEIRDMLEVYPIVAMLMLPPPGAPQSTAAMAPGFAG